MFKNIIIIILVFMLCSLMLQNKDNVKLIAKDLADTKNLVVDGAGFVKKTFEEEFSDVVVESTKDDPFSVEKNRIKEETFFEEEKWNEIH